MKFFEVLAREADGLSTGEVEVVAIEEGCDFFAEFVGELMVGAKSYLIECWRRCEAAVGGHDELRLNWRGRYDAS